VSRTALRCKAPFALSSPFLQAKPAFSPALIVDFGEEKII